MIWKGLKIHSKSKGKLQIIESQSKYVDKVKVNKKWWWITIKLIDTFCMMSPHFSFILYLPWLSSWELLLPPHQRSLWVLLALRHCIQDTYNSFRFRWFSWQSLWQWVPFWGLWFTFGIFILNRSCCQQIFSLLRGQFLKFLGTTKMIIKMYFFSGVDKWSWINDRESNDEDITTGVGEGSESVILFLACCIPWLWIELTRDPSWRFVHRLWEWWRDCQRLLVNIRWGTCFQCN